MERAKQPHPKALRLMKKLKEKSKHTTHACNVEDKPPPPRTLHQSVVRGIPQYVMEVNLHVKEVTPQLRKKMAQVRRKPCKGLRKKCTTSLKPISLLPCDDHKLMNPIEKGSKCQGTNPSPTSKGGKAKQKFLQNIFPYAIHQKGS